MAQRLISRRVVQQIAFRASCATTSGLPASMISPPLFQLRPSTAANSNANAAKRWYRTTPPLSDGTKQPEADDPGDDYVARHKRGLSDPDIPEFQNPLHHVDTAKDKIFEEDYAEGEVMPEIPLPPLSDDPNDIGAPPHLHALADEIVHLSMLEMTELIKKLQLHFGIEESDHGADIGGGGGGGGAAEVEEPVAEKTIFDLRLEGFDAKAKIKVIKEVRAIAGLGLKEAKDLVEGAPKVILKGIKKELAEEHKKTLVDAGAIVEIV
jgi:large subunit ribosomal protein L7/L12